MTVVSTNAFTGPLYGDGANTVFPFTFQAASASEIVVTVNGIALTTSQFTVSMEDDGTGSAIISPPPAGGAQVYVNSQPNFEQDADFQRFGPYFPDEINPHLDQAAIRDIYLKDRTDRAPIAPRDGSANGRFAAIDAGGNWYFPNASPVGDAALRLDLADPTKGASLSAYLAAGTGATSRDIRSVLRDQPFSAKDRGAIADGTARVGIDVTGIQSAITAATAGRAAVALPRGAYRMANNTESVQLPQSYSHIVGEQGTVVYGFNAPVLAASGASYVLSSVKNISLAGGTYGVDATTVGEIATLVYEDVAISDYSVSALRFAGGVTSCKFSRLHVNGSISNGQGLHSRGGINNNNVIADSDFTNCYGPAVKMEGLTQGLLSSNNRIEGAGRASTAQYDITGAVGVYLFCGWSETSHEVLLKLRTSGGNDSNDAVVIDGLMSIGSQYSGGGVVASKFDVEQRRVIFGTNWWSNLTIAPARCFIYGVNKNLQTDASAVHTRALRSSEHVTAPVRSFATVGAQTFDFIQLARSTSPANVAGNRQILVGTLRVTFSGYDGGGVDRDGVWEDQIRAAAAGNGTIAFSADLVKSQGNLGAITLTVQANATGATASYRGGQMVFSGVNTGLANFVQYDIDLLNTSSTEGDRFVVTVPVP